MPVFDFTFIVDAPLQTVSEFHAAHDALKTLTPPFLMMQVHTNEPMANGSVAEFTIWAGPVPVRWKAVHSAVSTTGFTDTQTSGPMKKWIHTHSFTSIAERKTRIHEHIEFEHHGGLRGIWSRLLFPRPALIALFTIRRMITKSAVRKSRHHIQP